MAAEPTFEKWADSLSNYDEYNREQAMLRADPSLRSSEPAAATPLYVWPMPMQASYGQLTLELAANLRITAEPLMLDLEAAIERFRLSTFTHRVTGRPGPTHLQSLNIVVASRNQTLQLETDVSYTLIVSNNVENATITANTVYGAYNALETLSQLITFNYTSNVFVITQAPLKIVDAPRFPHRGVLLDTARHYQSIPSIRALVDTLAMAKFNVLHWHMVDIQSFPYHSPALPRLSMGAYSLTDRYSISDLQEMVAYGRARGVRVMIEFDVPGHAQSWCDGYPEICPAPDCQMPIDPSTNATFDLLTTLFREMTGGSPSEGVFPERLFHLGGDEVDLSCWNTVDHVKQWLTSQNFTDKDAYRYVVEKAHDIVYGFGRIPINWDEVYSNFNKTIDPQTIIHVWRDESFVKNATRDGFRVLVSPDGPWYLDGLDVTWQQMYLLEPSAGITDTAQLSLILGGEACMWSETVDNSVLMNTVWPRAAAVAERLWSSVDVTDITSAQARLANFRCLLNLRGFGAAPLLNLHARTSPPKPGSCLSQ